MNTNIETVKNKGHLIKRKGKSINLILKLNLEMDTEIVEQIREITVAQPMFLRNFSRLFFECKQINAIGE